MNRNPQRARELADKYHALEMVYAVNPTQETVDELGRVWSELRRELLHQTGRTERRDERRFGDPAYIYERRAG